MAKETHNLDHLILPAVRPEDRSQQFRLPTTPHSKSRYPDRPDKQLHASQLRKQVETIRAEFKAESPSLEDWQSQLAALGIILEVVSTPGFSFKAEDLEYRSLGIRLLDVKVTLDESEETITTAVIFVPYGQLDKFLAKFDDYATEPPEGAKHFKEELFSSIELIRRASVKALWNDPPDLLPEPNKAIWWEVWIRRSETPRCGYDEDPIYKQFEDACAKEGIVLTNEVLVLREQYVVLIKATIIQIGNSTPLLNTLHGLRRPPIHAGFYMRERPDEQKKWVESLLERTVWAEGTAPAVTLIDTGVNRAHPLLESALSESDQDAYRREAWGVDDRDGHGTQMAGLALFGDLTTVIHGNSPIELQHRIESIKMIPSSSTEVHDPLSYGYIMQECLRRPKTWLSTPPRLRVFCLTVSSEGSLTSGRPSAWSTALDAAILNDEEEPLLVCVSAGNLAREQVPNYPEVNFRSPCHHPAQAWNAITVGAFTEKDSVSLEEEFKGYKPLAEAGALSPTSTTGLGWNKNWPIKPDIVMEGGNYIVDKEDPTSVDTPDHTQLLTTHNRLYERMFATTGDTSAATALAARYCAIILSENPNRWPETIRALLIHSARWNRQMTGWKPRHEWKFPSTWAKGQTLELIQKYGYGVPDLSRALKSAKSAVTLITEEIIQPFNKERNDKGILSAKTKGYNRHQIPIPKEILDKYYDKRVRLRVTLSYFIDPNPTNPVVGSKFGYQGAGIRFAVKSKSESSPQFYSRINQLEAVEKDEKGMNDSKQWLLGHDHRSRGSLHSDCWYGTAAELVNKDCVAVYPVGGWWKYREFLGKLESRLRYSLVISVETEDSSIDLYAPIKAQIQETVSVS